MGGGGGGRPEFRDFRVFAGCPKPLGFHITAVPVFALYPPLACSRPFGAPGARFPGARPSRARITRALVNRYQKARRSQKQEKARKKQELRSGNKLKEAKSKKARKSKSGHRARRSSTFLSCLARLRQPARPHARTHARNETISRLRRSR